MRLILKGKDNVVSSALETYVRKKLAKVEKQLSIEDTLVNVTLKTEKKLHIAEISFVLKGVAIRGEGKTENMYNSVDNAVDHIIRATHKFKTRLYKKHNVVVSEPIEEAEDFIGVVRTKKFKLSSLNKEEAIMEMDLRNYDFYVYFDIELKHTCVVYKRKDGDYGLIEFEE